MYCRWPAADHYLCMKPSGTASGWRDATHTQSSEFLQVRLRASASVDQSFQPRHPRLHPQNWMAEIIEPVILEEMQSIRPSREKATVRSSSSLAHANRPTHAAQRAIPKPARDHHRADNHSDWMQIHTHNACTPICRWKPSSRNSCGTQ